MDANEITALLIVAVAAVILVICFFRKGGGGGCGADCLKRKGKQTMRVFFLAVIFLSTVPGPSRAADFDRKDYEAHTSPNGHIYGSGKHSSAKASVAQETEVFRPEPTKLTVVDATPVDPGHIEWVNTYSITGSKKQWRTNGRRTKRKFLREHGFETQANIGVFNGFDFGITQGFAYLLDKENNYDETGGAADADGESLDETDGPHRGHGRTDLILNGRRRFYQSCDETLRVAYIPSITIPIGRRSNLDHLGPSQGYVSMGNTLAVTKDMNRWTMSGNAGYEVPIAHKARRENYAGTLTLAAGAGYHVFDWLQPQVEVIYEHDFEQSGKGSKLVSMVFGAIIPVNDHLRLDLGVVQGIAGSNADQTTSGVFKLVLLT